MHVRKALASVCPHAFLLSGVSSRAEGDLPKSEAWLAVEDKVIEQAKHHRWRLDAAQIRQYHLGGALFAPEGRKYWERMSTGPRIISFAHLRPCLTLAHLICEDLARVEPVAEVIRAVGPNLCSRPRQTPVSRARPEF